MREVRDDIYSVGAVDWDLKYFDRLIPLPDGTSYNSYLIKGSSRVALLDTVDPRKTETLVNNLVELGVDKIDYIIAHHAEQDHSGSLPDILALYPKAKIVTNPKCKSMLMDLLHIEEKKFITVDDREVLELGGKTLEFIYTPWVHWPETMCSYLKEEKILFTCDFFGSHFATSDLFLQNERDIYEPAKRYFAEIMMPFRKAIQGNLSKLEGLEIEIIAPSHGPIYGRPEFIIDCYKDWVSDDVKNEVVLGYVSMHGSTQKMAEHLAGALIDRGICVKVFELAEVDLGKLAVGLVDAATVVIATPTVLVGAHPVAIYAAVLVNALRPKTKFATFLNSYGWGSKTIEQLSGALSNLKAEIIEPVTVKGQPGAEDFVQIDELADKIFAAHKTAGLV